MIKYVTGSIFATNARWMVNPVNTFGVMGAGLAAEFKSRYPGMFRYYRAKCLAGQVRVGQIEVYSPIILFPTKEDWRKPSRLEFIEEGLDSFVRRHEEFSSVAFPKLGCGHGKLLWSNVKPLMERYLSELDMSIYIHV